MLLLVKLPSATKIIHPNKMSLAKFPAAAKHYLFLTKIVLSLCAAHLKPSQLWNTSLHSVPALATL